MHGWNNGNNSKYLFLSGSGTEVKVDEMADGSYSAATEVFRRRVPLQMVGRAAAEREAVKVLRMRLQHALQELDAMCPPEPEPGEDET